MDPNAPNSPESPYAQPQPPYQVPPHPQQPAQPQPLQSMPPIQYHGQYQQQGAYGQPQQASSGPQQPQQMGYNQQGQPVYTQAIQPGQPGGHGHHPQMVYMARPINPIEQPISPEIKARHEESRKRFPFLNLSPGEYIISAVRRHPIGLLKIWGIALVLIISFMAIFFMFFVGGGQETLGASTSEMNEFALAALALLFILVAAGAMAATYVYNNNRFFLTNESVVQEIQTSLFSKHEQTVSLSNIEDASFKQSGFIQTVLNYGTIRLSTEGDETTYRFSYVSNPKKQIAILNNAVEAFKNGRPVDPHDYESI
jgi:hypothetical protein